MSEFTDIVYLSETDKGLIATLSRELNKDGFDATKSLIIFNEWVLDSDTHYLPRYSRASRILKLICLKADDPIRCLERIAVATAEHKGAKVAFIKQLFGCPRNEKELAVFLHLIKSPDAPHYLLHDTVLADTLTNFDIPPLSLLPDVSSDDIKHRLLSIQSGVIKSSFDKEIPF